MKLPGIPGVTLGGGYDSPGVALCRARALFDAAHKGRVEIPPYRVWTGDEGEFVAGLVDDQGAELPHDQVPREHALLIAGDCRRRFEHAAAFGGDGFADLRLQR